jgi:hypothetical protein
MPVLYVCPFDGTSVDVVALGSGHHNIVLTPDEKKVFGQLFQAADVEGLGVVTGELAVKFFEKSGLSPRILGEVRHPPPPPPPPPTTAE